MVSEPAHDDSMAGMAVGCDDSIELTIQIGQATLSPAEFQQLRAGVLVVLEEDLRDPVTISAGSRLVARGEVLLIDGQVGIRITERYGAIASGICPD